ncbi:hypothetical protein FQR65_LT02004 [Abscondita terminalis]|nr:hypothetical protein FQR65_LT02004 [Abscondita terminalis]
MSVFHGLWKHLVYFSVCSVFVAINEVNAQCRTPDEKIGACIPIRNCPNLYSILEQSIINPDDIEFLRQSQCGHTGSQPKVCCASSPEELINQLLPTTDQCGRILSQRIVGGERAALDEFQWMALLQYQKRKSTGRGFHCGGALISDRYVLTAAHCILNIPKGWKLVSVRLGEHNLETEQDCQEYCADPPINVPVQELIPHEKYDVNSIHRYHDIALLRLQRKIDYTDYIFPVCLPLNLNIDYTGLNMTVAGWGRTENRSQSAFKLKLDVPVKPQSECINTYQKAKVNLRDGQICAGGVKGKDSCTGDSGGPLMYADYSKPDANYYITGVVSFGPSNCGVAGWPGVYTKVSDYVPWILSKMKL